MAITRTFLHGSISGYINHKCRCRRCKAAWAEYMMARARAAGRQPRGGGAYYPDKTEVVRLRTTVLGRRLLEAAAQREGRAPDDVMERLLRQGAAGLRFDESTGTLVA